ncbi:hypothetical protein DTO012A9_5763 [Penicillium roqueforti]|nr:hypothetical protein CBS147310_8271 [Penicillium roqueforti]KAI3242888.1 hypothetical protein DTO012A9_5763 [Penicillium roqueforti]
MDPKFRHIRLTEISANAPGYKTLYKDIYFAFEREVAEYYTCYAKRRSVCSATVIIHITIPNSVLESLPAPDIQRIYWPSAEWKSLILTCRRREKVPSNLRKYQLAKLVIGTICGKPTYGFGNMQSPDEVTERMVLKTKDGRNAVQFFFKGDDGDTSSNVAVFPLTTREFEDWRDTV